MESFNSSSRPACIYLCVVVYRLLTTLNATFETTRECSAANRSICNTMRSTFSFLCSIKSQVNVKIGRCGNRIRCNFVKFKSHLPVTLASLRAKMFSTFIFFNEVSESQGCSRPQSIDTNFFFLLCFFDTVYC